MDNLCERCYHNYVCEQYNENRDFKRTKCDYKNSHFVDAADVAPVRKGRWESVGLSSLKCSDCGYLDDMKMYHRYCPDCGCFMR